MKLHPLILSLTAVGALIASSCGGSQKLTPEQEVRNYGKYFTEKISVGQLDSLKITYPDILLADSLTPLKSDTILVVETVPGKYELTLAEGVLIKLVRTDDGNITVEESRGLFAFPDDKVKIARKTGMWDNKLNDAELNKRMKDKDFFDYIAKNKTVNPKNIITIGKRIVDYEDPNLGTTDNHLILTNNTDIPISGADYKIPYHWEVWEDQGNDAYDGKDLPPHGTARINWSEGAEGDREFKAIKWNLTPKQLQEKFGAFTGNEYQEYLDSKK